MASNGDLELPDSAFHDIWDQEKKEKDAASGTTTFIPQPTSGIIPSMSSFAAPPATTISAPAPASTKDEIIASLAKQVSEPQAARDAAVFERDFHLNHGPQEGSTIQAERDEAERKKAEAERLMNDTKAESSQLVEQIRALQNKISKQSEQHKEALARITVLKNEISAQSDRHKAEVVELAKVGGVSAEHIAARERVLEIEQRALEEARERGDICYEMRMDAYAEADEFRRQIMKAKEDTWGMIRGSSRVGTWVPDAADTIAYQHGQILELNRKLARLQSQRVDCSKLVNSNIRKPEPIPDRSKAGTFGLFYDDDEDDSGSDSDIDIDNDVEVENTIIDVPQSLIETLSPPSADEKSGTKQASAFESKGLLHCLSSCWRARKLILAGLIVLLLVLFDIYRILTPNPSSDSYSAYSESIYNDKEVCADDWNIHWTNGVPPYTHETPPPVIPIKTPEYEIVSHEEKPPPAWNVVRETGYDLRPESSPDPPVANGLLSGPLAVLSAGVFAADSYTWMMRWRGANTS